MSEKGDLHVEEEFGKAKRNVLWFCSFALLLWLIQPTSDGRLAISSLGTDATLNASWLKGAVWFACLYAIIGFYRQSQNVQRLNSKILYTVEFENLRTRLERLAEKFGELSEECVRIVSAAAPVKFADIGGLETLRSSIAEVLSEGFRDIKRAADIRQSTKAESGDAGVRGLLSAVDAKHKEIDSAILEALSPITESVGANMSELGGVAGIGRQAGTVTAAILELQLQFEKLSDQIRTEHRIMYVVYDKYLTYVMFALATIATWQAPATYAARGIMQSEISFSATGIILILLLLAAWPVYFIVGKIRARLFNMRVRAVLRKRRRQIGSRKKEIKDLELLIGAPITRAGWARLKLSESDALRTEEQAAAVRRRANYRAFKARVRTAWARLLGPQ